MMNLPPELIGDIVVFLDKDIHALYSCALVCHTFHNAATPLLYKRIHVSPPKVGLAWQVVEDTLGRKPFAASRLPSHRAYVEEFTLNGYITKIRPSRQTPIPIIDRIPEALQLWPNVQAVTLAPQKATGPALLNIVKALRCCPSLRSVTVNEFAMDDDIMPDLAKLIHLRELTLLHPTRALFMVLCSWISKLEDTLLSLHLLGNCGSLTPGILRIVTPHLSNIQSLSLGLSYALADMDIFACLSQLPQLRSLRLRYYRQYRGFPSGLMLPALRQFTVLHTPLFCKEDASALSTWIRRISQSSPLETLQTISSENSCPSLCFDGLISHLASQHRRTLLAIQMPKAYARGPALRTLLNKCTALQRFSLTVAFSTLKAFPTMTDACAELNTVTFDVCDHPRLVIEKKDAQKVLERVPQLRYVTVNGVSWKVRVSFMNACMLDCIVFLSF
ncbi:hypothetical protein JB92DRAFT_469459 [Gautieria morchelliformis]|nr:hypothetical protein JB92DRAFT_469459 [Gautieria morchelliformis]